MDREAAKKVFKKLAACYPNWKIDRDIAETWIDELEAADGEHVEANARDYIRENKFPPSIAEIIKQNERILAERQKAETRKLIDEQLEREKLPPVDPPWVREGIERDEWMRRKIAEVKRQ
ncbi:replicative helicase loader/inhibitor [Paenibacillus rhizolycopersici]|uniref:replicative helicase loader/inhibitor n=1 Tax=Paenibacillus rhizolycopersici TaxID=2780073 RepID=UPI003D28F7EE